MSRLADRQGRKRDLAARAAWLYYVAGKTQDHIATKLNISRQAAQRLVASAIEDNLVSFRLEHPISACVELGEALADKYHLSVCDITPTDEDESGNVLGVAMAAASRLEGYLARQAPITLAFATGRTLRETVRYVPAMERPQHKVVSRVGNMTRDGRASPYEVVMRLADRVAAQCFPMPTPVVAESTAERDLIQQQRSFQTLSALAAGAKATFVGISEIAWDSPMHRDGFLTDDELGELIDAGAVGETSGWAFDRDGGIVSCSITERIAGLPLERPPARPTIAVAAGLQKAAAITAALNGGLISGLIMDEALARHVCTLAGLDTAPE